MRCARSATPRQKPQPLTSKPQNLKPQPNLKPSFTGAGLEGHTFHKPDSAGSRCISCHMSDVNWRLLIRRRDHTFQPPVPENTAQFGIPNACTTCHDDRSPEWAANADERVVERRRSPREVRVARRHDVSRRLRRHHDAAGAGEARRRSIAGPADPRQRRGFHRAAGVGVEHRRHDSRQRSDADVVRRAGPADREPGRKRRVLVPALPEVTPRSSMR